MKKRSNSNLEPLTLPEPIKPTKKSTQENIISFSQFTLTPISKMQNRVINNNNNVNIKDLKSAKPITIHGCAQSGDLAGMQKKLRESLALVNDRNPVVRF